MTNSADSNVLDGVAIIGMAGRFPGAATVDDLWRNLCEGVESITFFTDDELDQSIDSSLANNANYVKAAGILNDADKFDASFFGMNPREAEILDPQQRLLLEVSWQALENAGYDPESFDGLIGVYAGMGGNSYFNNHVSAHQELIKTVGDHLLETVTRPDYLATRISYKLNLKGPSVSVYTACSTSLVAVCHGFDSLMSYQCDIALAGGSSILCPQNRGYLYQEGDIVSSDGRCRPFDAGAQGTVFTSGLGLVVLKRFEDARRDGDRIYGVIRGTAMNNDGSTKMSFMAPSVDGQAEVIAMAHANATVDPETISYVEAHGTGTALGDPIEIAGLTQAFRAKTSAKNFCAIASLKGNIGHLGAAAGIAGLIKTTMMLYHKAIPPSLHFEEPNPRIDFANSPFYVNKRLLQWQTDGMPRRAGVSSFGVGGTNAHVVLEEAPAGEASGPSRPWKLLLLSAKTSAALDKTTTNLAKHLKQHPQLPLADVAYTLHVGRKPFNHRRIVVCQDQGDAVTTLETLDPKRAATSTQGPVTRDVVFMFSGQGSQYVNMGVELYGTEPIFREEIDRCSEILLPHVSFDLRDILYPSDEDGEDAGYKLQETCVTQPALFTIEYALAKLWMAWGVHPAALVGHSIGEYVAACLAGVFSVEDALALVATRGRLMQELPGGSMLAVPLSEKEIQPFLEKELSLAAVNGPSLSVVSGEKEAVDELEKELSVRKVDCRRLHTSHAFHSRMVEPILDVFTEEVRHARLNPPRIPFLSNVTGSWITPDEATDPDYWAMHLRQTVRFSDCARELVRESDRALLEVGPGHTLNMLVRQQSNRGKEQVVLSSMRHPKEKSSDVAFILSTLGRLWLNGIPIDWPRFHADENRHLVPLPTYPFERKRYWLEAREHAYVADSSVPSSSKELENTPVSIRTSSEPEINNTYDDTPSNHIEQAVIDIWQALLGIKQVNIYDNFFDLGGSSLMAARLFAQIEQVFGKRLPLATLYQAPTVKELADILSNEDWSAPWASLVEIQTGNSRPPFFCIHGAGGNVLIYRDLARHLGPDQPFYGLQSQGLDGKQPLLTRIEDMASLYLQEVKSVQSQGPYFLGGFCMGGTIALEMAQQLHAQGEQVAFLTFFETYNWINKTPLSWLDLVYKYMQKVDFHWRNFLILESEQKLTFVREKAKIAKNKGKRRYGQIKSKVVNTFYQGNGQASSLSFELLQVNDQAASCYVPKVYPGRITQFRPLKEYAYYDRPEMGWDALAAEGVELYRLPVYPAAMILEPFVQLLAEQLRACIDKAARIE